MTTHTYGKLIQCGHTHYVGCDPCGCDPWVKVKPETVTITISRETADDIVNPSPGQEDGASIWDFYGKELVAALRAALEGER